MKSDDRPVKRKDPNRNFQLLMAGSFFSMLGSRISSIAFPLLALFLTNSPFDAGLVVFAATVPSVLVYLPAGALVDRWNHRKTMLVCEFGRGVAIATVAVSYVVGKPSILLLIPVVVVEELLEVFSTLAERCCVRYLVPEDRVPSAQVDIETRAHVVVLAGRPLGVLLFSIRPVLPFIADAASFAVSILSILSIAKPKIEPGADTRPHRRQAKPLGKDIGEAFDALLNDKYASVALALSAGTTLIGQALIMVFLASAHTSGLSSGGVGLALAASGAGGVLGAVSAPRLRKPSKVSLVLLQMLAWVAALVFLATWGWRSFLWIAATMAILSFSGALGNIEIDTYLIQRIDENMLAKVTSFGRLIAYSASAVGPVLGGLLIQFLGIQDAVFALVAITSVLALLACSTQSMRDRQAIAPPAVCLLQRLQKIVAQLCRMMVATLAAPLCHVMVTALGVPAAIASASTSFAYAGSPTEAERTACWRPRPRPPPGSPAARLVEANTAEALTSWPGQSFSVVRSRCVNTGQAHGEPHGSGGCMDVVNAGWVTWGLAALWRYGTTARR
jgi:MFS family permease